jgi:hypothetical protein
MTANGPKTETAADVLRWPGRVVSAVDLVRQLNGHRRLLVPRQAVLTPSAVEELRQRGVAIERETPAARAGPRWAYGQDGPYPAVQSAIQTLQREGWLFPSLPVSNGPMSGAWVRDLAERVVRGSECAGAVVFCENPALVCCLANKLPGWRAAAVCTLAQLGRVLQTFAPNLIAVEMPGRTFFEIRQMLRTVCTPRTCPDRVACALKELDGHAHR